MNCPRCKYIELIHRGDNDCEEVYDCNCGDGIVSFYECPRCAAEVEVKLDCKGDDHE